MAGQPEPLKKKRYRRALKPLRVELAALQNWLRHSGTRVVVLLEGRDAAGKGGVIHAITKVLNPRTVRVVALHTPGERERSQWYFQRYLAHLPGAGEMVLFDRSWYNRAGVEHVMGFCTQAEYQAFLVQAPVLEKLLTDDGIVLLKYWLSVDQERQEERFAERVEDPVKRWKLSPVDVAARSRYVEYGEARERMFAATHTAYAPWTVVDFNDQRRGRLNLIQDLLERLPNREVPESEVSLSALADAARAKENFTGIVQPIADRFGTDEAQRQ